MINWTSLIDYYGYKIIIWTHSHLGISMLMDSSRVLARVGSPHMVGLVGRVVGLVSPVVVACASVAV